MPWPVKTRICEGFTPSPIVGSAAVVVGAVVVGRILSVAITLGETRRLRLLGFATTADTENLHEPEYLTPRTLEGQSQLLCNPEGPSTQELGTWDFGNSNCSTGFG